MIKTREELRSVHRYWAQHRIVAPPGIHAGDLEDLLGILDRYAVLEEAAQALVNEAVFVCEGEEMIFSASADAVRMALTQIRVKRQGVGKA